MELRHKIQIPSYKQFPISNFQFTNLTTFDIWDFIICVLFVAGNLFLVTSIFFC